MTVMKTPSAQGGVSFDAMLSVFLGSTAPGDYPPTDQIYNQFVFKPAKDSDGVLVFRSHSAKHIYTLHRFRWEGEKIVFEHNWKGKGAVHFFTESSMGLMVQVGDTFYVTNPPESPSNICGRTYRYVTPVTLIRYAEGKITEEELRRSSLKLKLAEVKQASLEKQMHDLKQRVVLTVGSLSLDLQREARLHDGLQAKHSDLRLAVQSVPRWIWWLVSWFQQDYQRGAVAKAFESPTPQA